MKQWKIVRVGHAFVVEHAERVVPRVARVDHQRPVHGLGRAGSGAGTRPPARRAVSARSGGRSRPRRSRRSARRRPARRARPTPRRAATRRAGAGRRSRTRRRSAPRDRSPAATSRARCRRTPSTRRPRRAPAAPARRRRRARTASRRSRAADGSARRPTRTSLAHSASLPREQRLALLQLRARGQLPPRRGGGHALVLGPAGQAEPAPQLGRRVRDHRRREQRDDAQRLETVADHARDRLGVAGLVAAPTARGPR